MRSTFFSYARYVPNEVCRRLKRKITKGRIQQMHYAQRRVLGIEEGNVVLREAMEAGTPFMAAGYGANELNLAIDALVHKRIRADHLHTMKTNAGFFPEDDKLAFRFGECMVEETKKVDYDVAIIGCGAYGLPLAAKVKEQGKTAIHWGGYSDTLRHQGSKMG